MAKNGLIVSLAFLQFTLNPFPSEVMFLYILFRNVLLCQGIEYFTSHRPYVNSNYKEPNESFPGEFMLYLAQGSVLELATSYWAPAYTDKDESPFSCVSFIPLSFAFEIIFDFFHYWVHRLMHMHPLLYKLHKTHHKHHHVRPILAFYQNIIDLVLSNSLPFTLSLQLMKVIGLRFTMFQLALLYNYKIFIEIAGHSSRSSWPTCSFPQCIWLPRALNIELCSDDHNIHHSRINCNYAKRFSLWDRVFGTFIRCVR